MNGSAYDKFPVTKICTGSQCAWSGWQAIVDILKRRLADAGRTGVLIVDTYSGVDVDAVADTLGAALNPTLRIDTAQLLKPAAAIDHMLAADLGDDPVFGRMTERSLADFFDPARLQMAREKLCNRAGGTAVVCGPGAALLAQNGHSQNGHAQGDGAQSGQLIIYADMARWPIQQRFRDGTAGNLGADNPSDSAARKYKRAYFVDWRVLDRHKNSIFDRIAYFLDTTNPREPKLISGDAMRRSLALLTRRPFRVVPFFDPAPWGGRWMQSHFHLDPAMPNFGWGFDCVPEENSLLLQFGQTVAEIPAANLVQRHPEALMGEFVYRRFGLEFPIRFDMLDTIQGGNLSLQVHPLADYIRRHFGLAYTQDESYYILDALPGASVYLGVHDPIDCQKFADELHGAQRGERPFIPDAYVNRWPAQKHDHFLIPAGTCHCSGAGNLVLEISATPYIFTFKLWDWGRLGLDGLPRPVHLDHGLANIQWNRGAHWVKANLINQLRPVAHHADWREERTGLHESQFIETRRHWFTGTVLHQSTGSVNVLNLVQGEQVIVESPSHSFDPMIIHYAETFIVPAEAGDYRITPVGPKPTTPWATIKAMVRTEN